MKDSFVAQPVVDVEAGSNDATRDGLKRDMKARHINMIAIAGMIVSHLSQLEDIALTDMN